MKWEKRKGKLWTVEGGPLVHRDDVWGISGVCIIVPEEGKCALYDWFGHAESKTTYPTLEAAKLAAELIYG